MAEIQKPSEQSSPDDLKAGKPDSLNPDRSVSGADVGKAEKQRVNKFTTFGQMTTVNDGDSLDEARARQSALDNPFTIDYGNGTAESSQGKQHAAEAVIAGNPFTDGMNAAKKEAEKLWHPDREHPDIRMNYMADLEAFQATGLAKHGIDSLIIAATIRNEIVFRKVTDGIQDGIWQSNRQLGKTLDSPGDWTLGDAQMKRWHSARLSKAVGDDGKPLYPQLQGIDVDSTDVLSRQKAAALVGAYFQDVARRLEHNEDPIPWYDKAHAQEVKKSITSLWHSGLPEKRTDALIRSFNAGDGSRHVEHVRQQLKLIREGPAKLFE